MKKKTIYVIVIITIFATYYFNRNNYIESQLWKSNSKNKFVDLIEFNITYKIKGKNIIFENEKHGELVFCFFKYLIIKNKSGAYCLYYSKGNIIE